MSIDLIDVFFKTGYTPIMFRLWKVHLVLQQRQQDNYEIVTCMEHFLLALVCLHANLRYCKYVGIYSGVALFSLGSFSSHLCVLKAQKS